MSSLRRRRSLAQTTTEYMLLISVISLGLWVSMKAFSDPEGPVQEASEKLAESYEKTLDNSSGEMRMGP